MGEGEKLEGGKEFKVDEKRAIRKMEEEFEESSKYFCTGENRIFSLPTRPRGARVVPECTTSCVSDVPREQ